MKPFFLITHLFECCLSMQRQSWCLPPLSSSATLVRLQSSHFRFKMMLDLDAQERQENVIPDHWNALEHFVQVILQQQASLLYEIAAHMIAEVLELCIRGGGKSEIKGQTGTKPRMRMTERTR